MRNLSLLRDLFVRRRLEATDIGPLLRVATDLLAYAGTWNTDKLALTTKLHDLVEPVSRQFLVVDAIFSITQVLGSGMRRETWWDLFMAKILEPPISLVLMTEEGSSQNYTTFLRRVFTALEVYRSGRRPDAAVVVSIKREVFLLPCIVTNFRHPKWEPWRIDDDKFQQKQLETRVSK